MSDDEAEVWESMLKNDGLAEIERDVAVWTKHAIEHKQETFKTGYNNPCKMLVLTSVLHTKAWVHYHLELCRRDELAEAWKQETERVLGRDYDGEAGEM